MMYSAPNANVYAAATTGGYNGPAPSQIHAAVSIPLNINDGNWNEFLTGLTAGASSFGCVPGCTVSNGANSAYVGSPTWTVSIPANAHAIFTVTDAFNKGDNFNVYDGVTLLGTTPVVNVDTTANLGDCTVNACDPAVTSASSGINGWSHGQFTVTGAGVHNLNIKTVTGTVDPNKAFDVAYFKVDFACDKGFEKGIAPTAQIPLECVPIPLIDNPVGGMGIPIDSTALLLAGVQGSALWMIPAIVVAGAGIAIFKLKKKNQGETS